MELCKIYGEFETEELADLAAGRIRRGVRGVRRMTIHPLGRAVPAARGRERFTMLPANLRMMNYATDVMFAEMADSSVPEPLQRTTTELLVICDASAKSRVTAVMQSLGGNRIKMQ